MFSVGCIHTYLKQLKLWKSYNEIVLICFAERGGNENGIHVNSNVDVGGGIIHIRIFPSGFSAVNRST